jgi:hypothetical protein
VSSNPSKKFTKKDYKPKTLTANSKSCKAQFFQHLYVIKFVGEFVCEFFKDIYFWYFYIQTKFLSENFLDSILHFLEL